jgi:hypothetical protein
MHHLRRIPEWLQGISETTIVSVTPSVLVPVGRPYDRASLLATRALYLLRVVRAGIS